MIAARRHGRGIGRAIALGVVLALAACVTRRVRDPGPPVLTMPPPGRRADTTTPPNPLAGIPGNAAPSAPRDAADDARVALATAAQAAPLTATGAWRLFDQAGSVALRARANEVWTVEHRGPALRARAGSGAATRWVDGDLTLRTEVGNTFAVFAGRRYRGAIRVSATDSGLLVVNVVNVEEYLRGVVPLEIGVSDRASDQAALEAQAVAARSYTWVRLGSGADDRHYDLVAGVSDQVYGGADAERSRTDAAVRATASLVLKFGGHVVDAPYSSSCGGETAEPDEVWHTGQSPYLRRVSDRIPGTTNRYYCDIAPRFAWTKEFSASELDAAVRAYLGRYASVPAGRPGRVRTVTVASRTPSGRAAETLFSTDRGTFTVRTNDVRYVLRSVGGEILNSSYFSLTTEQARDGSLARVVIRGNGYGHGVGMCQWGAIGRARAGQTARSILAAYYPGTTVGYVAQGR